MMEFKCAGVVTNVYVCVSTMRIRAFFHARQSANKREARNTNVPTLTNMHAPKINQTKKRKQFANHSAQCACGQFIIGKLHCAHTHILKKNIKI